ncbi:MAG: hypothetical protein DI533_14850 [Cereibacter sphaeroides]|uniref:Glutathione metabolism protein n=1 Tax=Cereibacter sphaeroides TaxID=1063 RepID=A0A2W5SC83_CERSP|nr:MAG: hypothetical protein DI533_14850 [Cereibacter sphaeroides]
MSLVVTPFYASALTALFILLSVRVIGFRRNQRISLGDGNDPVLRRLIRAQGNCAEYAPLGLLLLLIAELSGATVWALHLSGVILLLGRVAHGLALSGGMHFGLRTLGMALTFTSLGLSAALMML